MSYDIPRHYRARPSQRDWELRRFLDLLSEEGVRTYVELGAKQGGTFWAVGKTLGRGATCVAVDIVGGPFGGSTGAHARLLDVAFNLRGAGVAADVVAADSQQQRTCEAVLRILREKAGSRAAGPPIDALLIDADHTYSGCSRDLALWGPHARIIALHDIDNANGPDEVRHSKGARGLPVECGLVWSDVLTALARGDYGLEVRARTIIQPDAPGLGIGVLIRGPAGKDLPWEMTHA